MIGELFAPLPPVNFIGISDLLPPKQKAPENLSGKLSKIQYLIKGTTPHSKTIFVLSIFTNLISNHFQQISYYSKKHHSGLSPPSNRLSHINRQLP
jgi:hypothetical protein